MGERFMRLAIEKAREGIAQGGTPFGACIAHGGQVVACAHNAVWQETDITAHAEIVAIREACRALNTIDLSGCDIYSTCEPCPMCFAACHWARLDRIFFGARIADAAACGFHELTLSNEEMKERGGSPVVLVAGLLRDECVELFRSWCQSDERQVY